MFTCWQSTWEARAKLQNPTCQQLAKLQKINPSTSAFNDFVRIEYCSISVIIGCLKKDVLSILENSSVVFWTLAKSLEKDLIKNFYQNCRAHVLKLHFNKQWTFSQGYCRSLAVFLKTSISEYKQFECTDFF